MSVFVGVKSQDVWEALAAAQAEVIKLRDEVEARAWAQNEDAVRIANLRAAVGELLDALGPDFDQNRRSYFNEMTALSQKDLIG